MKYEEYAEFVASINFTRHADRGHDLVHHTLSLCGEAGELAGKVVKKEFRGAWNYQWDALKAELGDCLYHMVALCNNMGTTIPELWAANGAKLKDRAERGVLVGDGDTR